ncbi:MAG: SpoIID/LytB domain-containing protein [Propionicimonas sp.]|uniref:SpoIID/LytB domain-containing protein n=1 Tax=Propionicimonas sp. TaxID=1955623 RepID=UPI002B2097E9|nr:SpoIID/LytB domain-containing protein [Propionicimonas sp.]MEA4945240.1 SpoIID/LytB domain-containing protein [Propionicimonas sp.]
MSALRSTALRRVTVLVLFWALVAAFGLITVQPAQAASYALTARSCGTTTSKLACTITVTFTKSGKPVAKATALLQYKKGSKWVTEKKVKLTKGKGTVAVKHGVTDRTYRVKVTGKKTGKAFTVHFIPATFSVKGSGSGHGVGMAQYGSYRMALDGKVATDILKYYYKGAAPGLANNPGATATPTGTAGKIKVQVFGSSTDARTTTLTPTGGGFTITGGATPVTTASGKPVIIAVSGSQVTATQGTTTVTAARLRFDWDTTKATVRVAGARAANSKVDVQYRYGNLQATAISGRVNVVNELVLNTEYLYGIDEMPASWGSTVRGMEALKAQVIAARTYALVQVTKRPGNVVDPACDCHVYDDTRSQNFTGWTKAGPAANQPWLAAVNATVHKVTASATFPSGSAVDIVRTSSASGSGFAETVYFASSGSYQVGSTRYGGTANNSDVFPVPALPYLVHVSDSYSAKAAPKSLNAWTRSLSQAKAKQVFGGDVKKLAVTARYSSGQAKSIRATFANGRTKTVTRKAAAWQDALGVQGAWLSSITGA